MGARTLVEFGRELRRAGVVVGTGRIATFAAAVERVPHDLYWAGRATLISRRDDIPVYDRVFRMVFGALADEPARTGRPPMNLQGAFSDGAVPLRDDDVEVSDELTRASRTERLRSRSFATLDDAELAELARTVNRLRLVAPVRRTRRYGGARRGDLDQRRTVRRALRTGGDPIVLLRRVRRRRARRVVLVLDISGSMSSYSRALLIFAHAALHADARWEAFTFGTRLTRLTGVLRAASPDDALKQASQAARDWDGGTRIGETVRSLLDQYSSGPTIRGAVVVILSDGLDVGDIDVLATQMARLHRLAYRVVWLNPLQENPNYKPLARGMAAALPFVDLFASGHNLIDLEATCAAIGRL